MQCIKRQIKKPNLKLRKEFERTNQIKSANGHIHQKIRSTLLVIREIQIKTTLRLYFHQIGKYFKFPV